MDLGVDIILKLPGLIDVHVHMREPGATHKEDWDSGTSAALAGGVTMLLAMPNTDPPIVNSNTFYQTIAIAENKTRCDFAQFIGAGPKNAEAASKIAGNTAGLKMYLDMTYGDLRLVNMVFWHDHYNQWPVDSPLVVHSEGKTLAAAILFADLYNRPVHIAHVSSREEIVTIRKAKEKGIKVTCEVTPHHLFFSVDDYSRITKNGKYSGRIGVRPPITTSEDVRSLWENLDVIDCFATDHAPHLLSEKDSNSPPPGFPGLETALPLLLNAVHEGRLTIKDLLLRFYTNPRRIFHLPEQPDTWIEVDPDEEYTINAANQFSKCGWTPFEGCRVRGRLKKVVLRGKTAYEDGRILVNPGYGRNIRKL